MIPELQGLEWRKSGSVEKAQCPKHVDKTPSLIRYPDGHLHCYSCGWHVGPSHEIAPTIRRDKEPAKSYPAIDWQPLREAWTPQLVTKLAEWRGYPERFVRYVINCNKIGIHEGLFCFPIYQDERIVRLHVRGNEGWFYYPTIGASITPFTFGSSHPVETHVFESQWDLLAVASQLSLYRTAWVATRGACGTARLGMIKFPNQVTIWPQNDEAGERWLEGVKAFATNRSTTIIRTPHHDPNDHLKAGGNLLELWQRAQKR